VYLQLDLFTEQSAYKTVPEIEGMISTSKYVEKHHFDPFHPPAKLYQTFCTEALGFALPAAISRLHQTHSCSRLFETVTEETHQKHDRSFSSSTMAQTRNDFNLNDFRVYLIRLTNSTLTREESDLAAKMNYVT